MHSYIGYKIKSKFKQHNEQPLVMVVLNTCVNIINVFLWCFSSFSMAMFIAESIIFPNDVFCAMFPWAIDTNWLFYSAISGTSSIVILFRRNIASFLISKHQSYKTWEKEQSDHREAFNVNQSIYDSLQPLKGAFSLDIKRWSSADSWGTTERLLSMRMNIFKLLSFDQIQPEITSKPENDINIWLEGNIKDKNTLADLSRIWAYGLGKTITLTIPIHIGTSVFDDFWVLGKTLGIDSMIESYISGVPIDDILL